MWSFRLEMNFSGDGRPSVSSMMKNNEKIMNFDRFMYTQSKSGHRRSSIRKVSNFDRNSVGYLVQLPVLIVHLTKLVGAHLYIVVVEQLLHEIKLFYS